MQGDDPYFNKLIRILATRCMTQVMTSSAIKRLDFVVVRKMYTSILSLIFGSVSFQIQAVYFCSGDLTPPEFYHYGLSARLYTHFTSPIRRYAGEEVIFLVVVVIFLFTDIK